MKKESGQPILGIRCPARTKTATYKIWATAFFFKYHDYINKFILMSRPMGVVTWSFMTNCRSSDKTHKFKRLLNFAVTAQQEIFVSEKFHRKRLSDSSSRIYFHQTPVVAHLLFDRSIVAFAYRLFSHSWLFWISHTCGFVTKFSQNLI